MKAGAWLVLGGTVAGFLGVLGLHRPASSSALAPAASPGRTAVAAGAPGTVTGPVVNYGYGELATRVAISGGRITAVIRPPLMATRVASSPYP